MRSTLSNFKSFSSLSKQTKLEMNRQGSCRQLELGKETSDSNRGSIRYYISGRLTEKSDVYSLGVVLLELITSKTVIEKSHERTHISQWVSFMLAKGDIKNVVDPRLHGDFDINSVWKAVEIAMACVSPNSAKRPTMAQVVMELNECLAIQTTDRGEVDDETNLKDYVELVNLNLHSELFPLAR
ncbi:hypothetical protein EZV62_027992 [Acer yangbiense]|uniref:Serine-threonine/tyrosine-protein kinase catalytic domain-containing protein n=1 Tax=Acer yangbiense TaxID=1000413 RepID=A0A5C7GQB3_9ROSI|nr:hypothetical protein EZV62_027992 [Acer yangbiense]